MEEDRCKIKVWNGTVWHSHRCQRKAWKDGFCKQHHPEKVKERQELSDRRYEEKRKHEPFYLWQKALERIRELETEIEKLKQERTKQ